MLLCIACLSMGLVLGSLARFSAYYRTGYREGRAAALLEVHREAIREGHGHWARDERSGPNRFAWNSVRHPGYAADAIAVVQESAMTAGQGFSWSQAVEFVVEGSGPSASRKR